ncbi:MAG: hypothetical protein M1816_000159 [Peltula sp. TS41687]|nr:MAG: hypothetical protein M1816_000159 [Peltula sp. TS41687]
MLETKKQGEENWHAIIQAEEWSCPSPFGKKWDIWSEQECIVIISNKSFSWKKSVPKTFEAIARLKGVRDDENTVWSDLIRSIRHYSSITMAHFLPASRFLKRIFTKEKIMFDMETPPPSNSFKLIVVPSLWADLLERRLVDQRRHNPAMQ